MARIEAGKQIQSGSGAGKSATYELDSLEDTQDQLDAVICELQRRRLAGDEEVPEAYENIQGARTELIADFSN